MQNLLNFFKGNSLITAAVTGKIDVRGSDIPSQEAA
jgi:hypothetical protein